MNAVDPSAICELLQRSKHILVIKLRYLGDSVWLLPFLENLKRNLPAVRLSVLVNRGTETFFYSCPAVDNVLPFPRSEVKAGLGGLFKMISFIRDLRKDKPDTVLDLTDGDRSAFIGFVSGARVRILYTHLKTWHNWLFTHVVRPKVVRHMLGFYLDFLQHMGLQLFDTRINIHLHPEAFAQLRQKLPAAFQEDRGKKIVVHIGARTPLRQWGTEKYARLCDLLADDYRIFLIAGPAEQEMLEDVLARMETIPAGSSTSLSLDEFAALCDLSHLFVGNDSGPIHIASARTFTVGIYGPTSDELAGPWTRDKCIIELDSLQCRPCDQQGCRNEEYQACLSRIAPEDVADKVRTLSGKHRHPSAGRSTEGT